jgi:glycosidase
MTFHIPSTRSRVVAAAALALALLGACGGGGSSAPSGPLPTVDTSAVAARDPGSPLPAGWQHGVFAEIYVRGYQDSDGDGVGDLRGLISRLDYLQDLGVSGIWLMPITQSQDRDHGYAVADYRAIEADYGTLADLDELIAQAHARGIGVVVDYVMNHSAYRHPAFTNSRADPASPFRDWYLWSAGSPAGWNIYGSNPWYAGGTGRYFAAFWDQMPDFNLRKAEVVAWHHDNLRFWLNRGVDGFRFDAVGHLVENGPTAWDNQPENYLLMTAVRGVLADYQRRWMVCEAPGDPIGFADACGSAFAFGHQVDIVDAAKGSAAAVARVASHFRTAPATMATMVSNHDSFAGQRLWDQVGGDAAQYKLAAATYLLQPGTPFVYYGEEIGMAGGTGLSGDWKLRPPMSWTGSAAGFSSGTPFRAVAANIRTHNVADQAADPNSLFAFYKAMIGLRNTWPSIARGSYAQAVASGTVMSFQRRLGSETAVVVVNYGTAAADVALAGLPANTSFDAVWPAGAAELPVDAGGAAAVRVPAQSVAVFTHRP